jgi:hypothetical protein
MSDSREKSDDGAMTTLERLCELAARERDPALCSFTCGRSSKRAVLSSIAHVLRPSWSRASSAIIPRCSSVSSLANPER